MNYTSKNILNCFGCLMLLFGITSCKKFVDVGMPTTLLATSNTFNTEGSATAALTSIYAQWENAPLGYAIPSYTGITGDELTSYSNVPEYQEMYKNNIRPNNSNLQGLWTNGYKYIYQANAIIEGLQTSTGVSDAVKKQLAGEAKFIRAFWHFYLTNLYGDIPVVTSTAYKTNAIAGRSAQTLVYQQIVSDLQDAQNNLNDNYVASDNVSVTTERVRPNKATAAALLSRVYLYMGSWANAETQATSLISNKALYDTVSLDNVFLKNSKETIWQLQPVLSGYNTPEGRYFILIGNVGTNALSSSTLSSQMLGAFESNDLRRTKWVSSIVSNGNTYYFPFKFKISSGSTLSEYSTVFRLGEQFLIRSEAKAQQNKLSEALIDLNIIRHRAGLPDTAISTQASLLGAIMHERQVELFAEWGHRWFDLKRTKTIDAVMNVVAPLKGTTWNANKQLFPIPQNEINNDPTLTQNPGY